MEPESRFWAEAEMSRFKVRCKKNLKNSVTSISKHEIIGKAGGPSEKLSHLHVLTD